MPKSKYDSIAEEYEKLRPEYPRDMIESLIMHTGIDQTSHLLEVGAGTGKATMILAEKGFKIDCIEIEPQMADILIRKTQPYPNISVTIDNFETWEKAEQRKYDLIYSAQAFHWIDENVRYKKSHELLKKNGQLALLWYISVVESTEMYQKLNMIFNQYKTGFSCSGKDNFAAFYDRERQHLEKTPYFHQIKAFTFTSEPIGQSGELFVERFQTTSAYASLDQQTKTSVSNELLSAIDTLGGNVTSRLMYMLFIADRV